ncbi:MAG: methyltransferase domain-containing protein [Actinomycetota bacterium]|nr:methyltransferase domain-containing protein [Actinomycetota bacterium]
MTWTSELFDELTHAGREHLDPAYVAGYDRKAGFEADAAEEVRMLLGLGLGSESTLVDLGAGTGTLALAAAPAFRRVVAVDVSPAMVAALRRKVAGAANVECVQAGFLTYGHRGPPADVVYSRNSLHHLPDFWKAIALERIAAILRPGGVFRLRDIVFSFDVRDSESAIGVWLENAGTWTADELRAHLRDEHSTFTWLLEPMLKRAGFEIAEAEYGARQIFAHYVCVKPK